MASLRSVLRWCLVPGLLLGALWTTLPADARDTQSPVVIELFTSQGCSSCPPADAYLAELAERSDLVALSLPITYWDYLGWRDTLAAPENTERQKGYQRALNTRSVYTPQMVIDGVAHVIGSRRREVEQVVHTRAMKREPRAEIRVLLKGNAIEIDLGHGPALAEPAAVYLLPVLRKKSVAVRRGENGGRVLDYYNVVRGLVMLGRWDGRDVKVVAELPKLDLPEHDRLAVLVQRAGHGEVLAARLIDRPGPDGPAMSSHRP